MTELGQDEIDRGLTALEDIAASLKVIPDAGEWLESRANRLEKILVDLTSIAENGLGGIEMTMRSQQP